MAQRIVAGEQYEAFLIGGDIEGRAYGLRLKLAEPTRLQAALLMNYKWGWWS
jgi:hypothetical protein